MDWSKVAVTITLTSITTSVLTALLLKKTLYSVMSTFPLLTMIATNSINNSSEDEEDKELKDLIGEEEGDDVTVVKDNSDSDEDTDVSDGHEKDDLYRVPKKKETMDDVYLI